jgi:hypothetical protein
MKLCFDVHRLGGLFLQIQDENTKTSQAWLLVQLIQCSGGIYITPVALEQGASTVTRYLLILGICCIESVIP